jgi:hypothetical protein
VIKEVKSFQGTNLRKKVTKKISRELAIKKKLKTYFNGIPCPLGHISERYVSNYRCVECVFMFYKRDKAKYLKTKKAKETSAKWWKKYYASVDGKKNAIKAQVKYNKKRLETDPKFKLISNLRSRFHSYLKQSNSKKISSITKLIGCSPKKLKEHLEKKFDQKMNWKNHGTYWHIDHIFPMKAFNIENIVDLKICFNFRNLQPLEKNENWLKNDNYSKKDFIKFKRLIQKTID